MFANVSKDGLPLFSHGNWRLNLKDIFGTTSVIRILIPTMQKLRLDGVDWEIGMQKLPEIRI